MEDKNTYEKEFINKLDKVLDIYARTLNRETRTEAECLEYYKSGKRDAYNEILGLIDTIFRK